MKEKPNNITQDGRDGEDGNLLEGVDFVEDSSYITGIHGDDTIGFKYFDFQEVKKDSVITRASLLGHIEIRTQWDRPV